ncbi:hypothetical protein Egran_05988 [Elaphomyces granulatus]|uniref:MalT-like TPR region domain-containing protein n=1 Tax=Elaphomyces granulatus TaxID=519963 RepID=A0A232LQ25_9EURO|nr:hypothetical protein Egran_05988 [Elaphomyces granulatus]
MGPRSPINAGHGHQLGQPLRGSGQAERGREAVPAGTARKGEGIGPRSPINAGHGQQLEQSQGKLDEAEKMYQRALQGYEKALGLENIARYRPALNTMSNQGDIFAAQGHLDEAKEMYSRAYTGFYTVLGPSGIECQYLEHRMAILRNQVREISEAHGRK